MIFESRGEGAAETDGDGGVAATGLRVRDGAMPATSRPHRYAKRCGRGAQRASLRLRMTSVLMRLP